MHWWQGTDCVSGWAPVGYLFFLRFVSLRDGLFSLSNYLLLHSVLNTLATWLLVCAGKSLPRTALLCSILWATLDLLQGLTPVNVKRLSWCTSIAPSLKCVPFTMLSRQRLDTKRMPDFWTVEMFLTVVLFSLFIPQLFLVSATKLLPSFCLKALWEPSQNYVPFPIFSCLIRFSAEITESQNF